MSCEPSNETCATTSAEVVGSGSSRKAEGNREIVPNTQPALAHSEPLCLGEGVNTVYFKTLETEAHRDGDRVGIPLASDPNAMDVVAGLVRDAGFDPVSVGR